ncbi:hypothetical protein [Leptospira kmetyi]|uniref:hypothetical protein n=1 Tax=Leptospira kmetyi TaxID=408139 RepID=UPI000287FABB|nr:hypothetical protein [Leptospira kmetyi]EQA55393.1 hypothetical protein LEP1GSC052_0037 [Leptospira kmetyi serovar Malaysia str. Bejo-Iso9]
MNVSTFILGAGFSHSIDSSFPLANSLLYEAKKNNLIPDDLYGTLLVDYINKYFGDSWENVNFEKVATFLQNSPFSLNGENIAIYSILYDHLIGLISSIIVNRKIIQAISNGSHHRSEILKKLLNYIVKHKATIISTNYDLIMDNLLFKSGAWTPGAGYGPILDPIPHIVRNLENSIKGSNYYIESDLKLFKLHGSLNWAVPIHQAPWKSNECYLNLPITRGSETWLEATQVTFNNEGVGMTWPYAPFIIPPVFGKKLDSNIIHDIWFRATSRMKISTKIYVIGYSFPDSDLLFERMMREGGSKGIFEQEKEIHIVNKFIDDSMKSRIENIFYNTKIKYFEVDAMEFIEKHLY